MGQQRDRRPGQPDRPGAVNERSVAVAIVEAVAEASGSDVTELPPLSERVDPDALVRLCESRESDVRMQFPYAGYAVTVGPNGRISVSPRA